MHADTSAGVVNGYHGNDEDPGPSPINLLKKQFLL